MGNSSSTKIECPFCKENGVISSTTKEGHQRMSLVMPVKFYDNNTNTWNTSNPNTITSTYICEHGHRFEITE